MANKHTPFHYPNPEHPLPLAYATVAEYARRKRWPSTVITLAIVYALGAATPLIVAFLPR